MIRIPLGCGIARGLVATIWFVVRVKAVTHTFDVGEFGFDSWTWSDRDFDSYYLVGICARQLAILIHPKGMKII